MVELERGVLMSKYILFRLSKEPKKRILELMNALFTRREMAMSSLTGRTTNAFRDHEAKPQLCPKKVSAICCVVRLPEIPKKLQPLKPLVRKPLESVVRYLEAHPCPPKPEGQRTATITTSSMTPIKSSPILNNGSPTILGKRNYEQHNGLEGTKPKALTPQWDIMSKRVCEPGRTAPPLQDQVHELD
ncbi:metastasis-associated protein MTA1-like [Sardina pilchardus]